MTVRAAPKTARTIKTAMGTREENPLDILTTQTPKAGGFFNKRDRGFSIEPQTMNATMKPRILESKVAAR